MTLNNIDINEIVKTKSPSRTKWFVPGSIVSKRTVNPIREVVCNMKTVPNPDKEQISLALGDPTVFGNFKIPESCSEEARLALDVFLASGASDALNIAIGALCDEGQNILLPRPGFSLYTTLAKSKGIECRYYDLLAICILINNPSNPCGSNFSSQHLESILAVAEAYKLVIITDEIYEDMVFGDTKFYPLASLTKVVPILKISGLAKRFLVPGWRVGWIFVYDQNEILSEIRKSLFSLSNMILGANSLLQYSLPDIILNTPEEFFQETNKKLEFNAKLSVEALSSIPGLNVIIPQGAMYIMIGINIDELKDVKNDVEFSEKLLQEESVMVLPGECFHYPNYVRIVFTAPPEKLQEAYGRIKEFFVRHHV
ncbi:5337_t:CDS:2 [Diversispora eburnea]|uniref:5337_t:CDS:1 n=1 Tax=Diversispora eburnea TaxID=1213867 RepID=A0A9N8V266_9GLOM|nr:5337_t:CDS:2 [Diversispora eburnea]